MLVASESLAQLTTDVRNRGADQGQVDVLLRAADIVATSFGLSPQHQISCESSGNAEQYLISMEAGLAENAKKIGEKIKELIRRFIAWVKELASKLMTRMLGTDKQLKENIEVAKEEIKTTDQANVKVEVEFDSLAAAFIGKDGFGGKSALEFFTAKPLELVKGGIVQKLSNMAGHVFTSRGGEHYLVKGLVDEVERELRAHVSQHKNGFAINTDSCGGFRYGLNFAWEPHDGDAREVNSNGMKRFTHLLKGVTFYFRRGDAADDDGVVTSSLTDYLAWLMACKRAREAYTDDLNWIRRIVETSMSEVEGKFTMPHSDEAALMYALLDYEHRRLSYLTTVTRVCYRAISSSMVTANRAFKITGR